MSPVIEEFDSDFLLGAYLRSIAHLPDGGASQELEACAMEFLGLLAEHRYSLRATICLLDPIARLRLHVPKTPDPSRKKGRPVAVKIYTNPHTGEEVRSRGGNLKVLMEWRHKFGSAEVSSWWRLAESDTP